MAMPRRESVDDYYDQLADYARPHLLGLRKLCVEELPGAIETLHWNTPVFVQDGTRLLMLQAFRTHCSLRFPTHQFATQRAAVETAGFEAGEGFIKLPYTGELPVELLRSLIRARLAEFEATGSGWTRK